MRASFHGGLWVLFALALCLPLAACGSGDNGLNGQDGASTGTLAGQVMNVFTGAPIAGAAITTTPAVAGVNITTDANGEYQAELPIGAYQLLCSAPLYEDNEDAASVLAAETTDQDFDMDPISRVIVEIVGAPDSTVPDAAPFQLTVVYQIMDGSQWVGNSWDQLHGTDAGMAPAGDSVAIAPADLDTYKMDLLDHLEDLNRYRVVGINPHSLELVAELEFEVTVMTTSGDHHADVGIHTVLPFATWALGINNVPRGLPVLLSGPDLKNFDWNLVGPGDPILFDSNTRYPWFVPAESGMYNIFEDFGGAPLMVGGGALENGIKPVLEVYAADWHGGVDSLLNGNPFMNSCTNAACHGAGNDRFFDTFVDWSETGHAHIFQTQLNTSSHYGSRCFACHTVGQDTTEAVANNGMDDQDDYQAFLDWAFPGGHGHPSPTNFDFVLANFPNTARMSNIQCENCHGPNGSGGAHIQDGDARMSLSSDVCAFCHGEPPRHARFQQWEESGHANYELAIDESGGSCQTCHTAQGWLAAEPGWETPGGSAGDRPNPDEDEVHPQTCALCHDPHNIGDTSGAANNAMMRIQDNAYNLASGFDATNVGKGAMCSTCHNGRRGLVNDHTGLPNPDRAPHGGPQTDVLFGENAFFVDVGYRGAHSFLENTCVTCHMELTPPPAELSYNLSGTNHTFEASVDVCTECHGAFDGGTLADQFEDSMHELEAKILEALKLEIETLLDAGYTVQINGHAEDDEDDEIQLDIVDFELLGDMHLTESHGRTAIDVEYDETTAYGARLGSGDPQGTLVMLDGDPIPNFADESDFASLVSNGLFEENPDMGLRPEVIIAQAAYNYFLLHNDGSHGFHYPSFAGQILVNTQWVVGDVEWFFAEALLVGDGAGGSDSTLWIVIPDTGKAYEMGTVEGNIRAMEYDPSDGTLYATPGGAKSNHEQDYGLYTVDILDGTMTLVGSTGWDHGSPDFTMVDGDLYGSPGKNGTDGFGDPYFGRINTGTGLWTNAGTEKSLVFDGGSGYAANVDGDAYWWTDATLYSVVPFTGEITEIADELDLFAVPSMTFYEGMLLGVDFGSRVILIDPTDGSVEEYLDLSEDIEATLISMTVIRFGPPPAD